MLDRYTAIFQKLQGEHSATGEQLTQPLPMWPFLLVEMALALICREVRWHDRHGVFPANVVARAVFPALRVLLAFTL